jgi:small-conductance mechanosensitive channel
MRRIMLDRDVGGKVWLGRSWRAQREIGFALYFCESRIALWLGGRPRIGFVSSFFAAAQVTGKPTRASAADQGIRPTPAAVNWYGMIMQWAWPGDPAVMKVVRPLFAFTLTLLVLLFLRHWLFKRLFKRSGDEGFAYVVIETLRLPSVLWCIAAAVQIGLEISIIPEKYVGRASTAIVAFLIVSLTWVLSSASVRALTIHGQRRGVALALSGLARTLIRVFIFTCGALVLLRIYNVNITPVLTALGVGGLAVALALQDTLANFFAGIHILIEEPIALGSFIRLSTGEEGVVTDIGWRTTRLRNGSNSVVVIPNTKITSGILINYNLPDPRVMCDVAVMVAFDADLEQVRRSALEETRSCEGVLATPEPNIFFNPGALSTHLQFTLVFAVSEFNRRTPVMSEVRLRIYRRMRSEGVPLPVPLLPPLQDSKELATA